MAVEVPADIREQFEALVADTVEVLPEEEFVRKLLTARRERRPLVVKCGYDPTAPDLHIGHAITLWKLKQFQDFGHQVVFLVGDFTAMIGDPSGRNSMRPPLSPAAVKANAQTYIDQVGTILDTERVQLRFNSEWCNALALPDVIRLASQITVARLLERDDFAARYANNDPISLHEFLYALIQGYDSVALRADIELGGTDQKFNLMVGRDLQRAYGQQPQVTMTLPLLVGLEDVDKMSKSKGNAIGIRERPFEMFSRLMSGVDGIIVPYFRLLRLGTANEIDELERGMRAGSLNPRDAKAEMAQRVVARFHDAGAAQAAREEWFRVVGARGGWEVPADVPEYRIAGGAAYVPLLDLLVDAGACKSKGEVRRLIRGGGLAVEGRRIDDESETLAAGPPRVLKVGKHRWLRVRFD